MTSNSFAVGDTIRHLKRGSRYRILRQFLWDASQIEDDGRYWLEETGSANTDRQVVLLEAAPPEAEGLPACRRMVMAQIDEMTRQAALEAGGRPISFLQYDSLDHPELSFIRPGSEFRDDRFERLSGDGKEH